LPKGGSLFWTKSWVWRVYKPKSSYSIYVYEFSYFAMHLIIMDFFRLGWLIVEYIFFWCFIYVHYINDFEQNSCHMFSGPLWILLPSIIIEMNTLTSPISS
jgi:hypothetical protein